MKRGGYLRRTKRVNAKRATPRRTTMVRNPEYLVWVRGLTCVSCGIDKSTEAHHMGARGMGQKCSDLEAVPMCSACHHAWHDANGIFAGVSKPERASFAQMAIADTQAKWLLRSITDGAQVVPW